MFGKKHRLAAECDFCARHIARRGACLCFAAQRCHEREFGCDMVIGDVRIARRGEPSGVVCGANVERALLKYQFFATCIY